MRPSHARPTDSRLTAKTAQRHFEYGGRIVTPVKLRIITVGHKPPAWITSGFQDYTRRMPREFPLLLVEVRPAHRDGTGRAQLARARSTERDRILAAIPADGVKVALDERGKAISTTQLAQKLESWMQDGRDVCFLIGGADGLDEEVKNNADLVVSLSMMTLPHALVRVVLAEQIYRAMSIIRKHPYHRH
jgi:23S rRNA (pseudouridine1915-N3)-methyltransferase